PLLAIVVLAAGCGSAEKKAAQPDASAATSKFMGSAVPGPPLDAPNFALRDQDGKLVRLSAQRGNDVVVAFLSTKARDVCPVIAGNLNAALRRLGPGGKTRVLAVSVDPKNDTPAAVRRYVKAHRLVPQFRYLIGTKAQLAPVWKAYHVAVVT